MSSRPNGGAQTAAPKRRRPNGGAQKSRTPALYLRLMPRRIDSTEGKKHVQTVPVKLRRPENSERKQHENANFAFATKDYLKCIASIFGSQAVFAVSIDDKAKVPIGVVAANKQAPLLMCLEYEVRLPDHDFVLAAGHKLTP